MSYMEDPAGAPLIGASRKVADAASNAPVRKRTLVKVLVLAGLLGTAALTLAATLMN